MNKYKTIFWFTSFLVFFLGFLIVLILYLNNTQEITKYSVEIRNECMNDDRLLKVESEKVFKTNTLACCGVCSLKYKVISNGKECIALYLNNEEDDYKWYEKIECPFEILEN
ncbi:MAG: hypothetical protein L3J07_04235 [Candidatus Magasanikbacteria bacterium]|nr:hypothetical protein [Candidatus Magasanikbacteria bacterium]